MKKFCIKIISLALVGLVGGCSSQITTTAERDYGKAENGPPLQVPKPLSKKEISHYYDLPNPDATYTKISIVPPIL
ncbi:MAG: hypothetical protein A3F18_00790 [Legionellales bacterium RIFCSPHIGHO2_12_FULL_37_14]|nr:MAG: hypothetical protein A3F18_00790 [Legionellales bacterium RIFCSPHIGHO2_12_FULL_37_14]